LPILYRHIRQDKNELFYIGIGESESRASEKRGRTAAWKNIAKKGYDIEVLFDDLSWEQACEKEIEFIALYGRRGNKTGTLVNMTDGGEGTIGYRHSDITKEKCRMATSGTNHPFYNKKRPDHSEKMVGENNPCYGRTGENHPLFGKQGYWKDKNRPDKAKKVIYNGLEFVSQTALAKYLGRSKAYVTKLIKQSKFN
jgi:hypothetical protein